MPGALLPIEGVDAALRTAVLDVAAALSNDEMEHEVRERVLAEGFATLHRRSSDAAAALDGALGRIPLADHFRAALVVALLERLAPSEARPVLRAWAVKPLPPPLAEDDPEREGAYLRRIASIRALGHHARGGDVPSADVLVELVVHGEALGLDVGARRAAIASAYRNDGQRHVLRRRLLTALPIDERPMLYEGWQ